MERDERYEVDNRGKLIIGIPQTLTTTRRKEIIESMFSINNWKYDLLDEISPSHFLIKLSNEGLNISKEFHLYHGNVRKEDPERSREEKKIQLGVDSDPREYFENALILGFYVTDSNCEIGDVVVVAWPIENSKNYPLNPSLRVNMKNDILPAKNTGYYIDRITGKKLVAFKPEFIYHYINEYKELHYFNTYNNEDSLDLNNNTLTEKIGYNKIYYGAPGCGKSFEVNKFLDSKNAIRDNRIRVTFHPEFSNCDFVGQILPTIDEKNGEEVVKYIFNPGPFTLALLQSFRTNEMVYLVIEEINRGNAAAIFGDLFQLLDRKEDGTSQYPICNPNIQKYLTDELKNEGIDVGELKELVIPSNLSIIATMNSSDQNVFTLDTAFKRRWSFVQISNDIVKDDNHEYKMYKVPGTSVTWETFLTKINDEILKIKIHNQVSEDKRLGKYFVSKTCLTKEIENIKEVEIVAESFAYKVLEYLWNDVCKIGKEEWFDVEKYKTLEDLVDAFVHPDTQDGKTPLSVFQNISF